MELTYQLERDDYWAYYQSVTRPLPPWRRMDFLPLFALSALIAYGHWSPNTRNGLLLAVVTGMGFFGLLFSMTLWREKEAYLKTIKLHPGATGLHTILLHPAGRRPYAIRTPNVGGVLVLTLRRPMSLDGLSSVPWTGPTRSE